MKRDRDTELPADTELARLIRAEESLEARLRGAGEQADRIVESARDAARDAERRFESELEGALREVEVRVQEEFERTRRRTADEAEERATRYDRLGTDRIEALARYVVARVIGGPAEAEIE